MYFKILKRVKCRIISDKIISLFISMLQNLLSRNVLQQKSLTGFNWCIILILPHESFIVKLVDPNE